MQREEVVDFTHATNWGTGKIMAKWKNTHHLKNNSTFECKINAWILTPKKKMVDTPLLNITEGLDDMKGEDSGWEGHLCIYPSHSKIFRDNWRVLSHKFFVLQPGATAQVGFKTGMMYFDPRTELRESTVYMPGRSRVILYRSEGAIVHGAASANDISSSVTNIDIIVKSTVTYQFSTKGNQLPEWISSGALDSVTTPTTFQQIEAHETVFEQ